VIAAGQGTRYKAYSFEAQTSFQIGSGSVDTIPQGISGIYDTGYSNGTVPAGTMADLIVGQWQRQLNNVDSYYCFVYDPNVSLDVTDSLGFFLYSINNKDWAAATDQLDMNTFIYDTGSGSTELNISCGTSCIVTGINDALWITGTINPGSDHEQGFLLKPGSGFIPVPEGSFNSINAVIGQGLVFGEYGTDPSNVRGFIGDASQGNTITIIKDSITCPSNSTVIFPGGINNNGQVVGYSEGAGPPAGFWYDANGCQPIGSTFPGGSGVAYNLNDYAEIVGLETTVQNEPGVVLYPTNH
jgi:probable HAF family extracellular repeat protein